jgi:hypothetical protein
MTYVPVSPATSQNAQRLAQDLKHVIDRHQRENPNLSRTDVQEALRLASMGAGERRRPTLVVAAALGVAVFLGLLAFLVVQRG